jgi:hypothetical protein
MNKILNKFRGGIFMGFCGGCGAKISADEKFCNSCGAANVNAAAPAPAPSGTMTAGPGELLIGNFAKFNAVDEDAAFVNVANVSLKANILFLILAGVGLLMFFLPFFSFSWGGWSLANLSGWDLAFGSGTTNFFAVVLFFVPFVLGAAFLLKKQLPFLQGKLFLTATIVSGAGLILLILLAVDVSNASTAPAFIIAVIAYLLAGGCSAAFMTAANKK